MKNKNRILWIVAAIIAFLLLAPRRSAGSDLPPFDGFGGGDFGGGGSGGSF
jgi:hypothetical protein